MADSAPPKGPRSAHTEWSIGKLLAHGRAPYLNEPNNAPSYYVRLLTRETAEGARRQREYQDRAAAPIDGREATPRVTRDSGGTRTLWGKDLERAIRDSRSRAQIGQEVGVRVTRTDPVTDGKGQPIPNRRKNIYEVERVSYINARFTNARKLAADYRDGLQLTMDDPQARNLFRFLSAAQAIASSQYPGDEPSQKRFMESVKGLLEKAPDREALIAAAAQRIQGKQPTLNASSRSEKSTEGASAPRTPPNSEFTRE